MGGGYDPPVRYGKSYEEQLEILYRNWRPYAIESAKFMMTSFKPGEVTIEILPRTPELFKERFNTCLRYATPLKMVRIDTWNDWYELTQVEPDRIDKFTYLKILKNILEEYKR